MPSSKLFGSTSFLVLGTAMFLQACSVPPQVSGRALQQCSVTDLPPLGEPFKGDELCGCDIFDSGALSRLQSRPDFFDIVDQTGAFCPEVALALTDVATASITDEDRNSDPFEGPGGGGSGDDDGGSPPAAPPADDEGDGPDGDGPDEDVDIPGGDGDGPGGDGDGPGGDGDGPGDDGDGPGGDGEGPGGDGDGPGGDGDGPGGDGDGPGRDGDGPGGDGDGPGGDGDGPGDDGGSGGGIG